MTLRRRLVLLAAAVFTAPLVSVIIPASPASAHGWITNPPSRQEQCSKGRVANCGNVQWEPQSVEAPKGSRACNGGVANFPELNNNGLGWAATSIGSSTSFTWHNTAMHRTTDWQYYVDGNLHQSFSGNASQPPADVSHQVTNLPAGRHTILGVWNILDTGNAFYACVDVNVGGGGGGTPPTTPPPTTPPPSGGCPTAWAASSAYTGGAVVSYNGRKYTARWWTQGETPGTTGEWGVWQDQGAC